MLTLSIGPSVCLTFDQSDISRYCQSKGRRVCILDSFVLQLTLLFFRCTARLGLDEEDENKDDEDFESMIERMK